MPAHPHPKYPIPSTTEPTARRAKTTGNRRNRSRRSDLFLPTSPRTSRLGMPSTALPQCVGIFERWGQPDSPRFPSSRPEKLHSEPPVPACVQIVFLGTSGSWPTPKRNVSAIAVKRGPEVILFDCGEGTQRQFMLSKLSFMQVTRVFITHFHGDHFLGLPGMVQSMSMNGRVAPLEVYGPQGIERLVTDLLSLGYFTPGFAVKAKELPPGADVDCGEYVVRGFAAVHTAPSMTYVLEVKPPPGRF